MNTSTIFFKDTFFFTLIGIRTQDLLFTSPLALPLSHVSSYIHIYILSSIVQTRVTSSVITRFDLEQFYPYTVIACFNHFSFTLDLQGATNVTCYFPYDAWFDVTAGNERQGASLVTDDDGHAYHAGFWRTFSSDLYAAPLTFQRGGTVVPRQMSANNTALALVGGADGA